MDNEKILSDLVALRKKIGSLQAELKPGVPYPVKSAKELQIKIRKAADELGMVMAGSPVNTIIQFEPCDRGTKCYVTLTVRYMSSDGSYRDFTGCGAGIGTDDKAAGKAETYAWKGANCKGLMLPDAEMVDADDEVVDTVVLSYLGKIDKCKTVEELTKLGTELKGLTADQKSDLAGEYSAKMAELKANGVDKGE